MQGIEKKIIRASAGTGKTYRLSLEYIGLLLKYKNEELDFSEILVITFTRKATAEIRQRIFEHLKEILFNSNGERDELEANLEQVTGISIGEEERESLKEIYLNMIGNKNLVQISTIDSFTNQIFKTVIGPYLGIMDYEIIPENDESLLAEIYQTMLLPENLQLLNKFYFRTEKRKISDFKNFVSSILDRRWIFDLMDESGGGNLGEMDDGELYQSFRYNFEAVLDRFQDYIDSRPQKSNKSAKELLNKRFYETFFDAPDKVPGTEIAELVRKKLDDKKFLLENYTGLLDAPEKANFWNGSRIYKKREDAEEKERQLLQLAEALRYFADWVFATAGMQESGEIREIARRLLKQYDEIKFREKKFTYNDISYYTYKYLYDPTLSLIEDGSVSNQFFEYLTGKIRFILIDEFQDTSVIQYKILYPMIREVISGSGVKDYGGVIVVGDEKQSIYGWRGGERDLLLNLDMALQGAESSSLKKSYRSERQIIRFVNTLFGDRDLQQQLQSMGLNWQHEEISDNKNEQRGSVSARFANLSAAQHGTDATTLKIQGQRKFLTETVYPLLQSGALSLSGTAILARKNQDLDFAASVLNELSIPYISESSLSVIQHPAIVPLFYFYQFCVYRDIYHLLAFLRSDYVLISGDEMREFLDIYRESGNIPTALEQAKKLPAIDHFHVLLQKIGLVNAGRFSKISGQGNGILAITKNVLEHYGVVNIFKQENDLKNIHLFFEVIALFESDRQTYTHDLRGFLQFCDDLQRSESFKQAGLETIDAVRLLTIHKAKGLEFENVIVLWNLSGTGNRNHGQINFYPAYSRDYSRLEDFAFTYNYDKVLPFSSMHRLYEASKIREAVEMLNLLYVAVTRAKSNLLLFFAFQNKKGLTDFFSGLDGGKMVRVDRLVARTLYSFLEEKEAADENDFDWVGGMGDLLHSEKSQISPSEAGRSFHHIPSYLTFEQFKDVVPISDETAEMERGELIRRFVRDRSAVKGDVAHYYLSFIKFDEKKARDFARKRTMMKYGSLLPSLMLEQIIARTNKFLDENEIFFSRKNWDQVFTELTVFSGSEPGSEVRTGAQFRIDRMMVNQTKKQIMILDYKSGEVWHEEQIEIYRQAVKELPVVKDQDYHVEAKYVKIDLS